MPESKIRNRLRKNMISIKFFLIFCLVFFLISLTFTFFSNAVTERHLHSREKSFTAASAKQVSNMLDVKISSYQLIGDTILDEINYVNSDIRRSSNFIDIIENNKSFESSINKAVSYDQDIVSISLYTNNPNLIKNNINCFDLVKASSSKEKIIASEGNIFFEDANNIAEHGLINLFLGRLNKRNGSILLLKMIVKAETLFSFFRPDTKSIRVINRDNGEEIFAYYPTQLPGDALSNRAESFWVEAGYNSRLFNWNIQIGSAVQRISSQRYLRTLRIMTWTAAVFCFLILTSAIAFWFRKRIASIVQNLNFIGNGEFDQIRAKPAFLLNDEFTSIERNLVNIGEKISSLMSDIEKHSLTARRIELQFIGAQFNAHFLYNTLSAMNWMAISSEADEISELILSLSRYYKLSLNKASDFLTLHQEIEIIECYTSIYNANCRTNVVLSYDIDQQLCRHRILKLLCVPIVESIISLSAFNCSNIRSIVIKAERVSCSIRITISFENGSEENSSLDSSIFDNPPIKLVRARIHAHYGGCSSLEFEGVQNKICQAVLILPYLEKSGNLDGKEGGELLC